MVLGSFVGPTQAAATVEGLLLLLVVVAAFPCFPCVCVGVQWVCIIAEASEGPAVDLQPPPLLHHPLHTSERLTRGILM